MGTGIGDVYLNVLPDMSGFSDELSAGINDAVDGAANSAGDSAAAVADAIGSQLQDAFGNLGLSDEIDAAIESVKEAGTAASDVGSQIQADLQDAFSNLGLGDELSSAIEEAGMEAGGAPAEAASTEVATGFGAALEEQFKNIGSIVGVIFAGAFVNKALAAYDSLQKATSQLQFGLEQLGQGAQLGDILTWAEELSLKTGTSEDSIVALAAKLTNLGKTFFDSVGPDASKYIEQLTEDMVNMAASGVMPLTALMRSVGPSILNTPGTAVGVLLKKGALTQDEVTHVKELVAANQSLAATQYILNRLQERYAGVAEKTVTPLDLIHNDFHLIEESVGKFLNPALTKMADILLSIPAPLQAIGLGAFGAVEVMFKLVNATGSLGGVGTLFTDLGSSIKNAGKAILGLVYNTAEMAAAEQVAALSKEAVTAAQEAETAAVIEGTAATAAFDVVNIVWIAAALAIAAAAYLIYKNWDKIKPVLLSMWHAVEPVLKSFWNVIKEIGIAIGHFVMSAIHFFQDLWKTISPVVHFIIQVIKADLVAAFKVWWTVMKVIFAAVKIAFTIVKAVFMVFVTVWKAEWAVIKAVFGPVVNFIIAGVKLIGHWLSMIGGWVADAIGWLGKITGVTAAWHVFQDTAKANAEVAAASARTIGLSMGLTVRATGDLTAAQLEQYNAMKGHAGATAMMADLQRSLDAGVKAGTITYDEYAKVIGETGLKLDVAATATTAVGDATAAAAAEVPLLKGQMTLLSTATGQTADALKAGLIGALKTLKTDGGAALSAFVKQTRASIKSWANSLATSFMNTGAEFSNLQTKSKQTMTNIVKDEAKWAKDQQNIAKVVGNIAKRAGTDSATVLATMSSQGITSIQELRAVARSSPKDFKSFQDGIDKGTGATNKLTDLIAGQAETAFGALTDKVLTSTDAISVLNGMHVTVPVNSSAIDSAKTKLNDLLNQLQNMNGATLAFSFNTTGKAGGGPVDANTTYLVGEKGPELFTPRTAGVITPNHQLERVAAQVAPAGAPTRARTPIKIVLEDGTGLSAYLEEMIHDTVGGR